MTVDRLILELFTMKKALGGNTLVFVADKDKKVDSLIVEVRGHMETHPVTGENEMVLLIKK